MSKFIKLILLLSIVFSSVEAEIQQERINLIVTTTQQQQQNHNILSSVWSSIVSLFSSNAHIRENKIVSVAKQKLGHKYVWGAVGKRDTFDCSGLTQYVYKKNGINLPRTSRYQSKYGKYVERDALRPGDLIFFDTSRQQKGYINHVGIYIGNGQFLHASSAKKKVVISQLNQTFYGKRFKVARRPL